MPEVVIYIGNIIFSFVCHELSFRYFIISHFHLEGVHFEFLILKSKYFLVQVTSYLLMFQNFVEMSCSNILVFDFNQVVVNLQHFSSFLEHGILEVVSSYFLVVHGLLVISFEPNQMFHN